MLMVDDYAYDELDFRGDPDIVLLEGSQWGDIGKKDIFFYDVFVIFNIKCFYVVYPMTNQILFDDEDVGPYHPPSSSPIQRRGERDDVAGVAAADYDIL